MPKLALKISESIVAEMRPTLENIPRADSLIRACTLGLTIGTGYVGGAALGTAAYVAGEIAAKIVTDLTGIPQSITCTVGGAGCSASLINYLGNSNSPASLALKFGVAVSSICWSSAYGAGPTYEGVTEDIENRSRYWQINGLLAGSAIAVGGACLGNPALGVFVGGIVSNLIAKVGRLPEVQHLHDA